MKILRIRRGFTTNFSASTEWIPPPPGSTVPGSTLQGSTGQSPTPGTPANNQLANNGLIVGGLLAAVVSAVVIERFVRNIRRTRRDDNDEEQADD